jgi:membrane fusion protein, multidrug efflux system
MRKCMMLFVLISATTLAACERKEASVAEPRPVRIMTVDRKAMGETVTLTGQVRAKDQVSLAFRLEGRMVDRRVHVGDFVTAGQVVAELDPQTQQNALRTTEAALAAAQAVKTQASLTFSRLQELLKQGWTPRAKFDEAQQSLRTAEAQVDAAEAQMRITQDQLSYATLVADAPGVVTAVGAEPGEVIHTGQMIVELAREGGRDALFDVPEQLMRNGPQDPEVEIALSNDPKVSGTGRVREVAPQADAATRTFLVKVGIVDPPEAMRLGATVTGRIRLLAPIGVEVPASALTEANGRPAVWVVDPRSKTVSLRPVEVLRYDPTAIVVSKGLEPGDILVTAGVQTLRPGQKIRLLGDA